MSMKAFVIAGWLLFSGALLIVILLAMRDAGVPR